MKVHWAARVTAVLGATRSQYAQEAYYVCLILRTEAKCTCWMHPAHPVPRLPCALVLVVLLVHYAYGQYYACMYTKST